MLNLLSECRASCIPAILLFQEAEQIEIIPPVEHGPRLNFQVFCNGMPIGQARLEKMPPSTGGTRIVNLFNARHCPRYALKMVQVTQNYRNRGIGTLLLKEILHYCRNHNIQSLNGEVQGDLPALRVWYRRNGFTIVDDTCLEIQLA
jgi:GNAT superfamily N-acetyltransferase